MPPRQRGTDPSPVPRHSLSPLLSDVVAWIVAADLAALGRYDFEITPERWAPISLLALTLAVGQIVVGPMVHLYGGRYQVGSFDEMRAVAVSATTVAFLAAAVVAATRPHGVPRSIPLLAWPIALLGMAAVRGVKRGIVQSQSQRNRAAERIVVLGAGWVGTGLIQQMLRRPDSPFLPVALLDDDPAKSNLQIHGVRVRGGLADLIRVAEEYDASKVVVAVADADSALLRRVSDACDQAGLGCWVTPALRDLSNGQVRLSALREIDVEDVIGRRPVDVDLSEIARYVTGRRVLVTGAGGSIGSELCRQLHTFDPGRLVLLDRDESALHAVELSIHGRGLLESPEVVLVDIRDRIALERVFAEHEPQVVFHAAALKHLTLLERYPQDALATNVYGTLNVLEAAAAHGVEHFVNISTDKAANPTSVLGRSKRLAERLTACHARAYGDQARFMSVRFGNVLGSRGSVLHTFAAQIEKGGPLTVTDPEVTRFFMTMREACQLVIQAGAVGRGGELLVLDMGDQVKIVDVASRMAAMSGKRMDIVFTGLRPGEKLHEELLSDDEVGGRPFHPLITHVAVPPLAAEELHHDAWVRTTSSYAPGESLRSSTV